MSQITAIMVLEKYANDCISCGICQDTCSLLGNAEVQLGDIARQIVDGSATQEVIGLIQRCDLCGLCAQECVGDQNPDKMIEAAREVLITQGKISVEEYSPLLVDQDWNTFSLYRETFNIRYSDLQRDSYDVLFFPGCTLAAYSPELTRTSYHWLETQGMVTGFSDLCCGKPLGSIGLNDRVDQLHQYLLIQMQKAGAHRLVTACPNCYYHLAGNLPGIKVLSLYRMMKDAGVRWEQSERLTVHDSCPDRNELFIGGDIRQILAGSDLVEMEHYGKTTICCGSGGIVSMIDPDLCQERARQRIQEYEVTGASRLVTACMACAHRLAKASQPNQVVHFLEMIFEIPVDYARVQVNLQNMWEGKVGRVNQSRLARARSFTVEEPASHA